MLSRADSYLDDALKLDCDERGDGSWGLSGPASTSPNVMDDALLNTTLSVVDFGTANDLEASTPISCGLGMAFVKDPSRPVWESNFRRPPTAAARRDGPRPPTPVVVY